MAKKTSRKKSGGRKSAKKSAKKAASKKRTTRKATAKGKAGSGRSSSSRRRTTSSGTKTRTSSASKKKAKKSPAGGKAAGKKARRAKPASTSRKKKSTAVASKTTRSDQAAKPAAQPKAPAPAAPAKAPAGRGRKQPAAGGSTTRRKPSAKRSKTVQVQPDPPMSELVPDKDGYVMFRGRRVRMISTKNITPKKKSKADAAERARSAGSKFIDQPVKTRLSARDLERFRSLLLGERARLMGDLAAMESQALNAGGGNLSAMPIHMADIGSDVYDQDFMLGMAESERRLIREIDAALQRIEDKTYGMCAMTGKPIPKARLNAKPWAKYTIEAARMVEDGRVG